MADGGGWMDAALLWGNLLRLVCGQPVNEGSHVPLAALLAMLNSCATGISVVNIDNGFGAGYMAALINRLPIYKPE